MRIGVPKEIKEQEYRVGLVPGSVAELVAAGHTVLIERDAGAGIGLLDTDYVSAGAEIVADASSVFEAADMIVKVKEPQAPEIKRFRPGQIIFTYFHFAASAELTRACMASGIIAIAYETITDKKGTLPLLTPMSEVAGKMSIQEGAKYLE